MNQGGVDAYATTRTSPVPHSELLRYECCVLVSLARDLKSTGKHEDSSGVIRVTGDFGGGYKREECEMCWDYIPRNYMNQG